MFVRAVLGTALLVSVLTTFTQAKRGFLFTVPGVLQQGTTEKGCVTFQELSNLWVRVQLFTKPDNVAVLAKRASLQDNGCLDLPINVDPGEYELEVTGSSDNYTYTDNATVRVEASTPLVFIQPDKPIYKPGQTVKFRILVVGADLKPRMDPISEIFVQDPNGVRMMQWLDETVTEFQGIADISMPLSTEPVQGTWKVSVKPGADNAAEEVSFKVKEYVLPKYEISVKAPSFFVINMKEVVGEVCAMYTYGEPVQGVLSLEVCYDRVYYSWQKPDKNRVRCMEQEYQISGCQPFNLSVTSLEIDANRWGYSNGDVVFNAKVLENATGITLNITAKVEVTRQLFQLDFSPYSSDTFKPGLPYHGKVKVSKPDGSPAPDETVEISMSNYRNNKEFRKTFESNNKGEVIFSLPPVRDDDTTISIRASMPDHVYDYSESHLQPYTPNGYHSIKQWFSPSDSFLQIDPIETVAGCDEPITLNITHVAEATSDVTFFYQLMSSGNLLKAGKKLHHYSNSRKRVYHPDGTYEEDSLYDCPEGKQWNNCASSCVATCEDHFPTCDFTCMPRCDCLHPKFVLHNGRCVEPRECPTAGEPSGCSGGRVRNNCSSACTATCDDPQPICTSQCVDRCSCPTKYPVWHGNTCITKEACPGYVPPTSPNQDRFVVSLPLTVDITPDMSPGVKLIVYYVRQDGETVADSISLKVAECSKNKVELQFTEASRYPGDEVTLSLRAAPGSVCSVGAMDKSVSLLGGKNALTLSEVLSRLSEFQLSENSIPGKDTYCEDQVKKKDNSPTRRHHNGIPRPPGGPRRRQQRSSVPWPEQYYSQYYDSMHAFKTHGLLALSNDSLNLRPCEVQTNMYYYENYIDYEYKIEAGSVDADVSRESAPDTPVAKPKKTLDVRTYFPETWLWDLHFVGNSGVMTLTENLPHTVTEWIASGFCSHTEKGIGVSETTAIKGFQPFFLSLTLPVSVVREEVLKLPVTVFNYLTKCLLVKVTLKSSDSYSIEEQTESDHCVCGQESVTAYFRLRFKELGDVPIKVEAESVENNGLCGNDLFMSDQIGVSDAVERPLLVEAEGREVELTETSYICPEDVTVSESVKLELPEDYVLGTPRATVSVIGDIMGPTLSGLDRLVRLPMGCGEQNMILFAPNIYVMQYLTSTDQVTKEVKDKALGYMQTGYQRELTYRHDDGSYSAFGKNDESGSTWLTAYVLKSFAQAKAYIFIDVEDLKKSIDWLMTKQMETGSFMKVGTVHHKDMKGGVNGGVSLTTFVLVALLEAKPHVDISNADQAISEAFIFLESQSITDTYTLTLLAYAYALSGNDTPLRQQVLGMLEERAIEQDGLKHWTRVTVDKDPADDVLEVTPIHKPSSLDVEMTAYMLLSLVATGGDDAVISGIPLVKWLSAQRNAYGGFSSTQDTVVALQALASYASLVYSGGSDLNIQTTSSQGDYYRFHVSDENRLLLQHKAFDVPSTLTFDVTGSGCALVQTTLKYNVANISRAQPSFSLTVSANRHSNCKDREMKICAYYEGTDGASNMAVIEVKMVSGWIPDKASIKALVDDIPKLKKYEIEMNKVNFYFDELTSSPICFYFLVEQLVEVDGAKPGKAEVYDYYDNTEEMRVTEVYEISPVCGTKEELPDVSQEEYDKLNDRDPSLIEQVRQPVGQPPQAGTKEDLPEKTQDEYDAANSRNPEDIEQVRQPAEQPPRTGTKEDLPDKTQDEYDAANSRNPEDIEQVRQPNSEEDRAEVVEPVIVPEMVVPLEVDPPLSGTKEDLGDLTQDEYDAVNRRNPEDIEQARQPVEQPPQAGTKEDLPDITQEEYDAANNKNPEDIEQVRQPVGQPPQAGTKEDLPELTPEEYDAANNRNPEDIEQVRVPEEDRVVVVEPVIVPEVVVPLGDEDLCPVCFDSVPEDIVPKVCDQEHVYKAVLENRTQYTIRLLVDYHHPTVKMGMLTKLTVPGNCECDELKYRRNGKILILTDAMWERKPNHAKKALLTLDEHTKIYRMPMPRKPLQGIERKIKRAIKGGQCNK